MSIQIPNIQIPGVLDTLITFTLLGKYIDENGYLTVNLKSENQVFPTNSKKKKERNIGRSINNKKYLKFMNTKKKKENDLNTISLSKYGSKYISKCNLSSKQSKTRIPSSTNKL